MTPENLKHYLSFLRNPQQVGAWCLRIRLSEAAQTEFQNLLNLDPWRFRQGPRYRFRPGYNAYPTDIAPEMLLRLFAYLRVCLPKRLQAELPKLAPSVDDVASINRRNWTSRQYVSYLAQSVSLPPRLSVKKKTMLRNGAKLFEDHFAFFKCSVVPDNPGKVDFMNPQSQYHLQASQEPQGILKIFSVHEEPLLMLRELLESVVEASIDAEIIRVFSPEILLMELYVPVMKILGPSRLLSDVSTIKNVEQVLDEANEERFVHAIRATGIAVEELMVEIYETYIHEKAPSSPLGELLSSLQIRLKEIVYGQVKKASPEFGDAKKIIGKFIEQEKRRTPAVPAVIALAEVLQKALVPLIEELGSRTSELSRNNQKEIKVVLFPAYVQRCVNELVSLRNRVSHRVEKVASSVTNVGYVEASLGLRAYVVLASWWYAERSRINYKLSRKKIVEETAFRSSTMADEGDELPVPTSNLTTT